MSTPANIATPAITLDAAHLAQRLGARRSGRGWIARCPAHKDRSPSLSIGEGRDGRILLHCFAGCSTVSVLAACGLSMSHLFPGLRASRQPKRRTVRAAEKAADQLQSRLTQRDRPLPVTVILTDNKSLDAAIARALALAVEGELVQIALEESQ
jgi:hypothetical protein